MERLSAVPKQIKRLYTTTYRITMLSELLLLLDCTLVVANLADRFTADGFEGGRLDVDEPLRRLGEIRAN